MTPTEELVCAIVRGDVTSWPLSGDDRLQQLVEAAFRHNLHLMLFDALKKSHTWSCWPLRLREKLETEAAKVSALDLIAERELRKVLIRLDEYGIRPLLLKGVPLAYTLYQSPTLRPRGDTDLLVRESDLERVSCILMEIGYDAPKVQIDKRTSYESLYSRQDDLFGLHHNLDVHWKINNAQLFAETFTFDELYADAIVIPSLASCALGLGFTHALLLACMHRFGHAHAPFYVDGKPVYAGDHLRWVYDIHLLCIALDTTRWVEFTTLAKTKRIAEFCLDGLNATIKAFNTKIPAEPMEALQTAARGEPARAQRLRASGAAWFLANLRALPGWRRRTAWIKQIVLPPLSYMREKYKTDSKILLLCLYGYRSVTGILKASNRHVSSAGIRKQGASLAKIAQNHPTHEEKERSCRNTLS